MDKNLKDTNFYKYIPQWVIDEIREYESRRFFKGNYPTMAYKIYDSLLKGINPRCGRAVEKCVVGHAHCHTDHDDQIDTNTKPKVCCKCGHRI